MNQLTTYNPPKADDAAAARAMVRLAASLRPRNYAGSPDMARVAAADAQRVLTGLSADALDRAVTRFISGEAGDGSGFMPTVAEVATESRRLQEQAYDAHALRERLSVRPALPPPTVTPESRARVAEAAALVKQVLASAVLRNEAARDYRPAPEKPRERTEAELVDHYAANPLQPSETIASMTGKRGA